jgi:hypothetical protein
LQIVRRADRFVVVRLEAVIHHLLDRMRIERAGRHDDETQRVADQVGEAVVLHQLGIFVEHGGAVRVLDMRLERDRPLDAQHLHQLRDEEDAIEEILLLVFRSLENLAQAAAQRL